MKATCSTNFTTGSSGVYWSYGEPRQLGTYAHHRRLVRAAHIISKLAGLSHCEYPQMNIWMSRLAKATSLGTMSLSTIRTRELGSDLDDKVWAAVQPARNRIECQQQCQWHVPVKAMMLAMLQRPAICSMIPSAFALTKTRVTFWWLRGEFTSGPMVSPGE